LLLHACDLKTARTLLEATAGGSVAAIAPSLAEHTHLLDALKADKGPEVTVVPENLQAEQEGAPFDAAVLDTDGPATRGNVYTVQLIDYALRQLRPGALLWVAGSNDRGVRTFIQHLHEISPEVTNVATGGGGRVARVVRHDRPEIFSSALPPARMVVVGAQGVRFRLQLQAGVFGAKKLDEATGLLLNALRIKPTDRVLDLGCGAGAIGITAALLAPRGHVTLADVNPMAVRLAQVNLDTNLIGNASTVLSDGYSALRGQRFEVIATNPPFHRLGSDDLDVALRFIEEAPGFLRPGGRLYVVANSFLPYEGAIVKAFGDVDTVAATPRYKVLAARLQTGARRKR